MKTQKSITNAAPLRDCTPPLASLPPPPSGHPPSFSSWLESPPSSPIPGTSSTTSFVLVEPLPLEQWSHWYSSSVEGSHRSFEPQTRQCVGL